MDGMATRAAWGVLLALVTCGGAQHAGAGPAPSCAAVAQHLVDLASDETGASAGAALSKRMRREFVRQQKGEAWTEERRRCLAAAESQDAVLQCPKVEPLGGQPAGDEDDDAPGTDGDDDAPAQ
jgi:hypothetical protein